MVNWRIKSKVCCVAVICIFSVVHWMDRFALPAILPVIQEDFDLSDDKLGLISSVFVLCNTISAPIFGYLGGHWKRRYLMIFGMITAGTAGFLGSFASNYWILLASRCCVGMGHAPWLVLSPVIIGDLYEDKKRMIAMTLFFESLPVGMGLGFVCASQFAVLFGSWRYGLRYTIWLFIIGIITVFFTDIPDHVKAEVDPNDKPANTCCQDFRLILRNKTLWLMTLVLACVIFLNGVVGWWAANYCFLAFKYAHEEEKWTSSRISLVFSIVMIISGILGIPLGGLLSQQLERKVNYADPLVVGIGMLMSAPLIGGFYFFAPIASFPITWVFVMAFFGMLFMNFNWAITTNVTLQVVVPAIRGTAVAVQFLFARTVGEALGPYAVGVISEELQNKSDDMQALSVQVLCLRDGLFISVAVAFVGAVLSFWCMRYINDDRMAIEMPSKEEKTKK